MKIMSSFTLKSLKAAPARTAVTIAGIALSSALLVAVMSTMVSAYDCLLRAEKDSNGAWMTGIMLPYNDASLDEIKIARTSNKLENSAIIERLGTIKTGEKYAERHGGAVPLLAVEGDYTAVCGIKPQIGRMPQSPDEILLPMDWKKKGSANEGDAIEISPGKSYTVTGFYSMENNLACISMPDEAITWAAFSVASNDVNMPANHPEAISIYMVFKSVNSAEDLTNQTSELFPDSQATKHNRLLIFSGLSTYDSVQQSILGFAIVLGIVIMLASISLIYNVFAISVNERMRQFGLLASIGASKRQLRNAVFLEALLMSVAGCVLGVGVGLAACAITFSLMGEGLSGIFGATASFDLVVSWKAIAIAVALTLATVLISAAIPSIRASRVSPIAALRQANTIKISRRAQRAAAKNVHGGVSAASLKPWQRRGIAGTVFGIGGCISAITHKRNASKGRAASISLAVAMLLLLTASSLTQQLNALGDAAGMNNKYDIAWYVGLSNGSAPTSEGGNIYQENADNPSYVTDVSVSTLHDVVNYLDKSSQNATSLHKIAWRVTNVTEAVIPADMAGSGFAVTSDQEGIVNGAYNEVLAINYVSDSAFEDIAKSNNISWDVARVKTPAIGVSEGFMQTGTGIKREDYFLKTGAITLPNSSQSNATIIGLVDKAEGITDRVGGQIIMPMSALPELVSSNDPFVFCAFFAMNNANASEDEVDTALAQIDAISVKPVEEADLGPIDNSVVNFKAQALAMKRTFNVLTTFCFLFVFIVSLIALGNVFNTITNGLILRRREFAVMESIGMARTQFRKMIASETCGYAIRGMIPGLILGGLVSYGLHNALGMTVEGIGFTLPWAGIGMSLALVVVVIAVSLAYGLHRALSGNTVEALRME